MALIENLEHGNWEQFLRSSFTYVYSVARL